ncbi:monooxygenase [Pseudomonas sp. WN033]|nr:monooxygenase [Pseudomonas sp. WN033]
MHVRNGGAMKTLQTLVIGAGQAGLATGWHLARRQVDFLILEAGAHPGGAWRHYYDSLELFSPARYSALPGRRFPGAPEHYPGRDEVVAYLDDYARHFRLPVRTGARVLHLTREAHGFVAETACGERYRAHTMVVATGTFAQPFMPEFDGQHTFAGRLLHSAAYQNPASFAGQRVVVVGSANSAVQIAVELAEVAEVTLASRTPVRFFPQRLLGLDFHFWVKWTGLEKTRWLKDQGTPVLDSGHYRRALANGRVVQRSLFTRFTTTGVVWPDGREDQCDAVIFATGFRPFVGFLEGLGVLDAHQHLAQRNGIARNIPGLFFVGFPRQRNFASATLRGVGEDAAFILPHVLQHLHAAAGYGSDAETRGVIS